MLETCCKRSSARKKENEIKKKENTEKLRCGVRPVFVSDRGIVPLVYANARCAKDHGVK